MRLPIDNERVICPASGEKVKPGACWDSFVGGKKITYGIIPLSHKDKKPGGYVAYEINCDWAGLPAPDPVEIV